MTTISSPNEAQDEEPSGPRTHLTAGTDIIEREFVAPTILSSRVRFIQPFPNNNAILRKERHNTMSQTGRPLALCLVSRLSTLKTLCRLNINTPHQNTWTHTRCLSTLHTTHATTLSRLSINTPHPRHGHIPAVSQHNTLATQHEQKTHHTRTTRCRGE